MRNDLDLLEMMLADERKQNDLYRPGPYWKAYQGRIVQAIRRKGIENFRAEPAIGKGYADTLTGTPSEVWHDPYTAQNRIKTALTKLPGLRVLFGEYQNLVTHYLRQFVSARSRYYEERFGPWLKDALADFDMPESTDAGCTNVVTVDGQGYGEAYLKTLMRIDNFSRHVDFAKARIAFEIGGGFGVFPHLLIAKYPNVKKFIYLDIPPMIYVGTQYLKHHFGDAVTDYRTTRGAQTIEFADDDRVEIICLCPWQIERLRADVDVFWNTASFSEMTPDIVANYAGHIARLLARDGTLCLLVHIEAPHQRHEVTLPDQITSAFAGFAFQRIAPQVELDAPPTYLIGARDSDAI